MENKWLSVLLYLFLFITNMTPAKPTFYSTVIFCRCRFERLIYMFLQSYKLLNRNNFNNINQDISSLSSSYCIFTAGVVQTETITDFLCAAIVSHLLR